MALTAMLGLTGLPMAIGALAVFGSSFMNYVLFDRLKLGIVVQPFQLQLNL